MAQNVQQLRVPTPLPTTTAGFLAHRKLKAKRTINDIVEDIHLRLVEDDQYIALIEAVYHSMAVEGNMNIDDAFAAKMIRDYAEKNDIPELAQIKLDPIVHALRVVLNRYGFSRKQRRLTVSGGMVPEEATQDEPPQDNNC